MIRTSLTILLVLLLACEERGRDPALPPLPELKLALFEPAVRRQLEEALTAVRTAPRSAEANGRLGLILHSYGWLPQAGLCYRRAARLAPGEYRWHYYLARIRISTGEWDAARKSLERAHAAHSTHLPTLTSLGDVCLEVGDLGGARRWYEQALEISPDFPPALLGIGRVRFSAGDVRGAIAAHEKALDIDPDFREAAYSLALVYRAQGDAEEAERYLEIHAAGAGGPSVHGDFLDALHELRLDAEHVYRQANSLAKEGRHEEAVALYRKVLTLNPVFSAANYNIGLALLKLERAEDAIPYLREFLEARPDHIDAHNNLGLCFLELGRYEDAARSFEKALSVDPGYSKAHFNLGLVRKREGRVVDAMNSFRAAIGSRPRYPEARFNLAVLLLGGGDRDAALTQLVAALEAEPGHAGAHETLFRLFAAPGDGETGPRDRSATSRRVAAFLHAKRLFAAAIHVLREKRGGAGDWKNDVTLAWILATCPEERLRRPREAVLLMEPICEEVASGDPTALDTLAASYAAAGRFDDARKAAVAALESANASGTPAMRKLRERIAFRLRLYEENRAFHEK